MNKKFRALLCLLLYLFYMPSYSQALPAPVFVTTSQGGVTTFGTGTATAANASSISFPPVSNAPIYADVRQSVQVGGGRAIEVVAKSSPAKVDVARAVGNFARGVGGAALKTAGAVYAVFELGKALNDLCLDLGYRCIGSPNGAVVERPQGGVVGGYIIGVFPPAATEQAICDTYAAWLVTTSYAGWATVAKGAGGLCQVSLKKAGQQDKGQTAVIKYRDAVEPTFSPASVSELEDAIASASGWPSSSSLPKVVEQAIAAGHPLPLPKPNSVTGPTVIPSTPTTTNNPDGSTTTRETTKSASYGPDSVTVRDKTTETTRNPDGSTKSTTTTESEPEPAPSDTPLGNMPVLYTPKYKEGLIGVWKEKKDQFKNSALVQAASKLMPTVGSGGTCPKFVLALDLGPWNYGNGDVSPPCWVWDACKAIVICGALLLCRALVFGG